MKIESLSQEELLHVSGGWYHGLAAGIAIASAGYDFYQGFMSQRC